MSTLEDAISLAVKAQRGRKNKAGQLTFSIHL